MNPNPIKPGDPLFNVAPMARDPECMNCLYWLREDDNKGVCRRRSPQMVVLPPTPGLDGKIRMNTMSMWPPTAENTTCGDHRYDKWK